MLRLYCFVVLCVSAAWIESTWARKVHTHISGVTGARINFDELSSLYKPGYVYGVEAGIEPRVLGFAWSLLASTFDSAEPSTPDIELNMVEMEFAVRARWALGASEGGAYGTVQSGFNVMRTSVPIPPRDTQFYSGLTVGSGFGFEVRRAFLVHLGVRYGFFGDAPRSVSGLLSIGFGNL